VTASSGPTFGSILGGVVGAGLGAAGQYFGAQKGCWVAAAAFNEDFFTGVKTNAVRTWLYDVWSKNWYAKPVLALYSRCGKWVASKPSLVKMLKPLFELALRKSQEI
jgi:hypothetical protein